MKKFLPLIITIALVLVAYFWVFGTSPDTGSTNSPGSNVTVSGGVQYVAIDVRGGYRPQSTTIQSGIPTRLVMKTNNTYDCSTALVIRSIGYRNQLPATGETEIDIGTLKKGDKIVGTCSMGMYRFTLQVQ